LTARQRPPVRSEEQIESSVGGVAGAPCDGGAPIIGHEPDIKDQ